MLIGEQMASNINIIDNSDSNNNTRTNNGEDDNMVFTEQPPRTHREIFMAIVKGTLHSFNLLRDNLGFLLISAFNFVVYFGMMTSLIHALSMVYENSIKVEDAIYVITISIFVDIPARVAYGVLADFKCLTPIKLNTLAIFLSTLALFLYYELQKGLGTQIIYAILFTIGTG